MPENNSHLVWLIELEAPETFCRKKIILKSIKSSYQTPEIGLKCAFDLARASIITKLASIGFRCCSDSPP